MEAPARLLPSLAFSCALAQWCTEEEKSGVDMLSPTTCSFEGTSNINSSVLAQQAILLFPEVVGPLVGKSSARELKKERWKNVLKHKHFMLAKIRRSDNPVLGKLVSIYVERSHPCLRSDKIIQWLLVHCERVVQKLNPRVLTPQNLTVCLFVYMFIARVRQMQMVRKEMNQESEQFRKY
eukprot:TRINITY_DN6650_c0_g1_i1.p1 TRINITY_DN6650_c0_g1~~TRINITY_DN6650_c0_g1_i1.p1  ORF type:complete len:180 (+),score=26.14 TRINITY_DN6650_c0_g1_i1:235-774(+)